MAADCKLCGRSLSRTVGRTRCRCGWRLDADCRSDHEDWCPVGGAESWLGAHEF